MKKIPDAIIAEAATKALIQELRDALNDMLDTHGPMNTREEKLEARATAARQKADTYLSAR